MSLIPARWRRPVATTSPEPAPEVVREAERRSERLTGPRGRVVWIVQTASGGKSDWDTEHEALERAKESAGACVYPVLIEESA